jgi:hypothetical protein
MACQVRDALLNSYNEATALYARSTIELMEVKKRFLPNNYEQLKTTAATSEKAAKNARALLEAHMAEHDCEGQRLTMHAGR